MSTGDEGVRERSTVNEESSVLTQLKPHVWSHLHQR